MHPTLRLTIATLLTALAFPSLAAGKPAKSAKPPARPAAVTEIRLAHAFGEAAEAELQKIVDRFNAENAATPVRLVRLDGVSRPALLNILRRTQVAEFVGNRAAFKPLFGVMKEAGVSFDANVLSKDLRAGVSDGKGRLLALPVAYSTPVLFYNRTAFRKAKLDPDTAPVTWQDVQEASGKLMAAGYSCPYTTSWPSWVHVDNASALAGAPVANGKGDLVFNGLLGVKHLAKLSAWKKAGIFHVFGRRDEADEKFRNGDCVMLTSNSSAAIDFLETRGVEVGVAPLPYYDDSYGGRRNTLADGASLWVGSGFRSADYKVAARFIRFLMNTDTQVMLSSAHGQLPLTEPAAAAIRSRGERVQIRSLEVAQLSMRGEGSRSAVRVASLDPVRIVLDEELEKLWDDKVAPKEALDTAVARGNAILKARPALRKAAPI